VTSVEGRTREALFEYLLRLADDRLVLGHRLSEWCGHGPVLEEDIAVTNIALDLIGQANLLLGLAGEVEGRGRDADALAYLRDAAEFRCHPLVELPRGDYAFTIVRQFLFDAWHWHLMRALSSGSHPELSGIAAKAAKEHTYHLRHSAEWVVRLGDGTEESHARARAALDELWRYTGTLFRADDVDRALVAEGIAPDPAALEPAWRSLVEDVMARATLVLPEGDRPTGRGYRRGDHTEHLGHMLAEMQVLPRTYPGAKW
jgi:ring-1,2-phenylacetyl-CoA epoxidase subunit PaaC